MYPLEAFSGAYSTASISTGRFINYHRLAFEDELITGSSIVSGQLKSSIIDVELEDWATTGVSIVAAELKESRVIISVHSNLETDATIQNARMPNKINYQAEPENLFSSASITQGSLT